MNLTRMDKLEITEQILLYRSRTFEPQLVIFFEGRLDDALEL